KWWQILPLGPTGYGNSPYQSPSSFAGNPLLINLDRLVERGWLDEREVAHDPGLSADHVDFDAVAELKGRALRRAWERFRISGDSAALEAFRAQNRAWLDDYSLYQALRDAHGGRPWYEWEPELVARDPSACDRWRQRLAAGISYHQFVQFVF